MMYGSAPGMVANAPQSVRMAFVRKVYGLFFASILTSVLAGYLSLQDGIYQVLQPLTFPMLIVTLVIAFGMRFAQRVPGLNLFMLYLFSAIWGVLLGPFFAAYNEVAPGLPLEAGILASAVFGGLTLYVLFTKQDFNFLGGFLFASLIALIVAGFVMMFFHAVAFMTTVYCVFGILIFAGYVLYDTSNIMTRLRYDEAPIGAMNLYLDFLNLIMLILRLLGGNRD